MRQANASHPTLLFFLAHDQMPCYKFEHGAINACFSIRLITAYPLESPHETIDPRYYRLYRT